MYVLIKKKEKKGWCSKSKKALSDISGISYGRLRYMSRKIYYEDMDVVFMDVAILKSGQGGFRKNAFKK